MSVKVITKNTDKISTKPFPKIMSNIFRSVVLFSKPGHGTLLMPVLKTHNQLFGDSQTVGFYSDGWDMSGFTDYIGEISLSND